ncbi:ABC transporter ATP-binding protein [Phycisphaerales bacterium AB-hyl4]|uniref:ABC transporter ATP-binding protein n=1 Tax=Natronomicrosphaera hydrolytica TaxID=3242702 RepID=A0ABV4U0D6_9BACT
MNEQQSEQPDGLVRLDNVSKSFGSLHVLRDVSLRFERGKTTVILGPSGTGKSVLLKHIVGLLRPDAGEVYFDEQRVDRMSPAELVEIRKHIGFLFQMGALFDSMNVGENVAFPLVEHTRQTEAERDERVEQVLEMVGLPNIQKKMPADLSGGQRKRVALARAIVLNPSLILYDEPTTGLDPIRSDVINELIIALNRRLGITSIVVTHDMVSANKIADRLVLLYDGRIVCDGDPQTFHNHESDLVQRFVKGQADKEDLDAIRRGFEQIDEKP